MIPAGWPVAANGSMRYFGSVDSTPLFLILAAHMGFSGPAVEEALDWLLRALRPTGLLTYIGHESGGLSHQGWRDELPEAPGMGVRWPDGRDIERPVAIASAQGWAFNALIAHGYRTEANALANQVEQTFFTHGELWPALAVDGAGKAVATLTSEIGILLWSGILNHHRVKDAVTALDRLASAWGLYTVAPEHPIFSPTAYHYGAIWPFECWFAWGGLRAAGAYTQAENLRRGVLRAIELLGGMPECYAVPLDGSNPSIIGESTRTQAWTAGAVWALEHDWDGR
jgi:glycogen debranching enzyme